MVFSRGFERGGQLVHINSKDCFLVLNRLFVGLFLLCLCMHIISYRIARVSASADSLFEDLN